MIGALRHRVTLASPTLADDGGGGGTLTYTDVVSVWARVQSRSSDDAVIGHARRAVTRLDVRIRWRSDVNSTWRVRYDDTLLPIVGLADPDGRRRWLDLIIEEEG